MANVQATIDIDVFRRTTGLFAAKRSSLPPDAVASLASEIVRRLADVRNRNSAVDVPKIPAAQIDVFCDLLIQSDPAASLKFIAERRAAGMSRQAVALGYVAGAARRLGDRWDRREVTLSDVTVGTGHLYALMRSMQAEPHDRPPFDNRRVALFATVPGEEHGLGITMAADLFRDEGWQIDLQIGSDHESLLARIDRSEPRVIGLSLSSEARLDALVRLVVAVRLILPGSVIGVAPASSIDPERLRNLVDIDLVFTDAPSAFRALERWRG